MVQTLKDIAVFFDSSVLGQRVLELASGFAESQGARLIGVWAAQSELGTREEAFARGDAIADVIRRHEASVAAQLLQTGQGLAEAATRHGINIEFRVIPGSDAGSAAALRSLYCDLLIVGYPNIPGVPSGRSCTQLLEQTGEPLLIIPEGWQGEKIGHSITVAWNASRPARRAVADALPLLVSAKQVDLLIVDPDPGLDSESYSDESGIEMLAYLQRQGVEVQLRRVASNGRPIAEEIATQARDRGSDLVVFGAYSHSRLSEWLFGGVTRSLMAEVPLPLFVSS